MAGNRIQKNIFWFLFSILLLTGIGISVYFGLEPKPILKIKLSGVAEPKGFAEALAIRLNQEIQKSDFIFIGLGLESEQQKLTSSIIENLLITNSKTPIQIFIDPQLAQPDQFQKFIPAMAAQNQLQVQEFSFANQFTQIHSLRSSLGKKVFLTPNVFATSAIKDGPFQNFKNDILKSKINLNYLNIVISSFPTQREEEKNLIPPCLVDQFDQQGTGAFGCQVLQSSRPNYRKKIPDTAYLGSLQQVGENEYLLLFKKNSFF